MKPSKTSNKHSPATTMSSSAARRRHSPLFGGAFFIPVAGLTGLPLIQSLSSLTSNLISKHSSHPTPLHRAETRSLLRKLNILLLIFESLTDYSLPSSSSSSTTELCLSELYSLLHWAGDLLDCCSRSSRLWLLLRGRHLSAHFHSLTLDLSLILDVLPISALNLPCDIYEHAELLRRQCHHSTPQFSHHDNLLRCHILSFLDTFANGQVPSSTELYRVFFDQLGVCDAAACCAEIEFLEELIYSSDKAGADDPVVLGGLAALARYCGFLLFEFQELDTTKKTAGEQQRQVLASMALPKEFCCPISLDVMQDPVIAATGQTYDRASIARWMDNGHRTCPNSGQTLSHTRLVPNLALGSLISHWCEAHGIACDPSATNAAAAERVAAAAAGKAAVRANRATSEILVRWLSDGVPDSMKTIAAYELRMLAKTGEENRVSIAEAGAIPLLCRLLCSPDSATQEHAVTAILNLSIFDDNKSRIIHCLSSVVGVLIDGRTAEARENAAATLFSLSVVHDYKPRIAAEPGAAATLARLLRDGSPRGRRDAVTALSNLATHPDNSERMAEAGAVAALVEALWVEELAEEAAAAVALLARRPAMAWVVGGAVAGLVGLMRSGSPRGKENAVAALHEICRSGGDRMTKMVAGVPALGELIRVILLRGTKRAKRKAAELVRMCKRCGGGEAAGTVAFGGGWVIANALAGSTARRGADRVASAAVPV